MRRNNKLVVLSCWLAFFLLLPVINYPLFSAFAATFSLSPASGTFNRNCNFSLDVVEDTAGADTDGADAILIYDTSRLTTNTVTNGTIYPDFPGNSIDLQLGKVFVSGLASINQPFNGQGKLATVNFTVKSAAPAGATQVKFDFNPQAKEKTDDSNIVQRTTIVDILNSVVDGNYVIGTGTTCLAQAGASTPPQGATGAAGASGSGKLTTTLPPAGTQELTAALTIIGSVLTVLGIIGLVIL